LTPLDQDALAIVFKVIDGAGPACNDYAPRRKNRALGRSRRRQDLPQQKLSCDCRFRVFKAQRSNEKYEKNTLDHFAIIPAFSEYA
jgi:hypothetical protein